MTTVGPVGRLGAWTADHFRAVLVAWIVVAVGLGVLAPRVETALSGAGWEASGSQSVQARDLINRDFGGQSSAALMVVVHSSAASGRATRGSRRPSTAWRGFSALTREWRRSRCRVPGSPSRRTGTPRSSAPGRTGRPTEMVAAADALKSDLKAAGAEGVQVSLTGASGMWSDFNVANRNAMMKSELLSWPVTLVILLLAFGSLVAAGLPLMLTILGLVASAGTLYLGSRFFDISIWAMNFALMFALALGIDYALFVVHRFRGAFFGSKLSARDAVAETMDTAGKAVLFSGATVLISLSAVMLVPSPAFRSMALGIMVAVVFVLLATMTLLPAVLAKLGPRVDRLAVKWVHSGEHRSPVFAAWAERLWRRPLLYGTAALAILVALTLPVLGLRTGMPSIKVVPKSDTSRQGYDLVQSAFGEGAPGALQIVGPALAMEHVVAIAKADPGVATSDADPVAGRVACSSCRWCRTPTHRAPPSVRRSTACARSCRPGRSSAARPPRTMTSSRTLSAKTPLVIGVVLALGFLLLLLALQAPVIAAVGVVANLLAVGAAFGVARLIFQDGHGAGLLGFEPQGFIDAWGPVFFFAMIFAISMDYTVFLLSSAKEHYDRAHDPKEAMVGGVAHSGRVIFAAAAVMVAVFLTFALSGPLPPKEMGVILGVAVLLDALLIRLVLIPVALRLLGTWAWGLPRWLDRVLPDVRFGHS